MFSGIVSTVSEVLRCERKLDGMKLVLALPATWQDIKCGDSISVNGICLTVEHLSMRQALSFSVISETLRCSTLGDLQPGDAVNLEQALQFGAAIGGHFVQGHSDGTAQLMRIMTDNDLAKYYFKCDKKIAALLISKGFVAIDGMSLTCVDVMDDAFSVCLIPYTLKHSIAGSYKIGQHVNIEIDIMTKTLVNFAGYSLKKIIKDELRSLSKAGAI